MPQRAVEHPTFAVLEHEGHRVALLVDLRLGLGQHGYRRIAVQTGVQFVGGLEGRESSGDRVIRTDDFDAELAVGIVPAQLRIPGPPGQLDKVVLQFLKRPAGEMDQHQAPTLLDEPGQVAVAFRPGDLRVVILEVHHHRVVVVQLGRTEEVQVFGHFHGQSRILSELPLEDRRGLLPQMALVVFPGDDQHALGGLGVVPQRGGCWSFRRKGPPPADEPSQHGHDQRTTPPETQAGKDHRIAPRVKQRLVVHLPKVTENHAPGNLPHRANGPPRDGRTVPSTRTRRTRLGC